MPKPVLNLSALQRDVIRAVAFLAMVDHIATAFQADLLLLNMYTGAVHFAVCAGQRLRCNMAGKPAVSTALTACG